MPEHDVRSKAALASAIDNKTEPWLEQMQRMDRLPWPAPARKGPQVSIKDWLNSMRYQPLDAASKIAC